MSVSRSARSLLSRHHIHPFIKLFEAIPKSVARCLLATKFYNNFTKFHQLFLPTTTTTTNYCANIAINFVPNKKVCCAASFAVSEVQAGTMDVQQELQIRVESPGGSSSGAGADGTSGGMAPPLNSGGCCNGDISFGHQNHNNNSNNNNNNHRQQQRLQQQQQQTTGLMMMANMSKRSRASPAGDDDYGGCGTSRGKKKALMVSNSSISRQSQFLRSELLKTGVAFLCLAVSAFLNFLLLTIIHDIVPREPLKDLVWFIVPQQSWAWPVGDVLSTVNSVVGFCIVILHRHRVVILRRVFLIAAILYGLRAIVLGVTFLPPAFENRDKLCRPQMNGTSMYVDEIATRFVTYVVTLGLTSGQPEILCGDLMFSGHTVVLSIMYFTQLRYSPRGLYVLRWIALPITFMGIAALVLSGGHYTVHKTD
uniref:Sphingomyelin synthase-like domain-containing protein n=1 Tax=Globodera rostochiensis TaxID=31243 RepID=A0A914GZK4_GLORO